MTQPQDPFFGPAAMRAAPAGPLLDTPITASAVERLVTSILARPGADSDFLLLTADAVQEVMLEAPSDADTRRLAQLRDQLRLRATIQARSKPGQAEAAALLRVCPATGTSLRMLRSAMQFSCSAWGWQPLLDAMIAAADEIEAQPPGRAA